MTLDIRWLAPTAIVVIAATPSFAAQYMSVEQARALIFAQAQEFVAVPVSLTPEQIQRVAQRSGVEVRSAHFKVWQARAAGELVGWFILDQVIGKHEFITYATGINPDGTLRQFQIIEYREAYGSQVRYLKWRDQFVGKTIADKLEIDADIVNISGATLSCRHLTDGIKQLLALHDIVLR
jgi:hypothetical protein